VRRAQRTTIAAIAAVALAWAATPAWAQNNPWANFFGGLIQGALIDNAVKKWQAVDPDVRQCLANTYGLNAAALAQNAITPDDYRLQNQMQYCNQQVMQARAEVERQRQQAQNAANAARAGWNSLSSEVRQCARDRGIDAEQFAQQGVGPDQMPVRGTVQSCRDQAAQLVLQKQRAEARHKELVARYSSEQVADIEAGRVTVGMSRAAVLEARGREPDRKDVIPPDDEMWVYGDERISISNGKVTYVGH
jgi:hypothetical protein